MTAPKYQYSVVAYKDRAMRTDGNGYYYLNPCDIVLVCDSEEDAIDQAKTLVKRDHYEVFNVQELQT